MSAPSNPRRRWLRFSLRSFMLLVLVVAVSLGWMIHKAREQMIAVAALKEMGCEFAFDNAERWPTVLESFRKLLSKNGSRTVIRLYGANSTITDAGLAHLRGLADLQELFLQGTHVTDAGLVHLRGLTKLRVLILDYTQV